MYNRKTMLPLDVVANIFTIRHEEDAKANSVLKQKLKTANASTKQVHIQRCILETENAKMNQRLEKYKLKIQELQEENKQLKRKQKKRCDKSTQT